MAISVVEVGKPEVEESVGELVEAVVVVHIQQQLDSNAQHQTQFHLLIIALLQPLKNEQVNLIRLIDIHFKILKY